MSQPKTVDSYLASLDNHSRAVLTQLDGLIRRWQPDLPVTLWQSMGHEIIGYGQTSYRLRSGKVNQWFIVGLAAHKSYFSLYLWGTVDGRYLLDCYRDRLGKIKVGRACLNFKELADLNLDVLELAIGQAIDSVKSEVE